WSTPRRRRPEVGRLGRRPEAQGRRRAGCRGRPAEPAADHLRLPPARGAAVDVGRAGPAGRRSRAPAPGERAAEEAGSGSVAGAGRPREHPDRRRYLQLGHWRRLALQIVLPFIRILQPAPFPELLVKRYDDAMLEASERADQLLEA